MKIAVVAANGKAGKLIVKEAVDRGMDVTAVVLQLTSVRNVKAARALLSDHDNDVDKLKEAEPRLFEAGGKHAKGGNAGSGTTGLPNAGAASDEGKTLKHWREIAGLTDDDNDKKEG